MYYDFCKECFKKINQDVEEITPSIFPTTCDLCEKEFVETRCIRLVNASLWEVIGES